MSLRMEEVPACLLCGTQGTSLYKGLHDRLYSVPGTFELWHCPNCGFIWLNPRPIQEDIPKLYETYYTHQTPKTSEPGGSGTLRKFRDALRRLILEACYAYPSESGHRLLRLVAGRVLGAIPLLRARAAYGLGVRFLAWCGRGRLLDVGCGNGFYLSLMRTLGWDVAGVEVDSQAIAVCRAQGLSVFPGTLEEARFPDDSFDVITMNHVIEHVSNPLALLQECYRILSPGGYVAIVTPNVKSLAYRLFRESWFHLDPPRHLCLFHSTTLRKCVQAAGFRVIRAYTWSQMVMYIYDHSRQIRLHGKVVSQVTRPSIRARAFAGLEKLLVALGWDIGEEVCVLAQKPAGSRHHDPNFVTSSLHFQGVAARLI